MSASGWRSKGLQIIAAPADPSCPREARVSTTFLADRAAVQVVDTRPAAGHDGAEPPRRQRADGKIAVSVAAAGGVSRVTNLHESGASRVRFPRSPNGLDGVMLNVAGGVACGDRMTVDAEVGPGAALALATPGAERIYRSDGDSALIQNRFAVAAGGRLAWLPQETILFDGARLRRRMEADIAADGRLTICEALVFGRTARGETVASGMIEDVWRVRRGGKLVFAETLRLSGPVHALLGRRTVAAGATALATILHIAPGAEARLDAVRDALASHEVEAGASAWNGFLVLRILTPFAERLREAARAVLPILIARPLPRVWSC